MGDAAKRQIVCFKAVVEHELLLGVGCECPCRAVVEVVHQIAPFVDALHQDAASPLAELPQVLFRIADGVSQQELCLADVGCDECGEGEEFVLVCFDCGVAHQLFACEVHDDGVDEYGLFVVASEHTGHGADDFLGGQHARLDAVGPDGAQEGFCLRDNQLHGQVMDALDAVHVLVHDTCQCCGSPASAARDGLDVGLYACTPQRFAARNEEYFACFWFFLHIGAQSYDV